MKRPVTRRIEDALKVLDKAAAFVGDSEPQAFAADEKAVYAVERCFTVLGEALRHVPDEVREAHPEVPWREILGMRNRITHDYLYTDLEMLWRTVRVDFPAVRPLLQRVLDALNAEGT
jgi:uncharacterized protein with HEPN domain